MPNSNECFELLWKYVFAKLRLGERGDVQEVAAAATLSRAAAKLGLMGLNCRRWEGVHWS